VNHAPLIRHILEHSSSLAPLDTGTEPVISPTAGIRAVVFDIYGTLFISCSGDISLAKNENRSPAIIASLSTAGFSIKDPEAPWGTAFMKAIKQASARRSSEGIAFPEVRIEEVWEAYVEDARKEDWLTGTGDIKLAIVDHECRVNPCWPMPGLDEILTSIHSRGLAMGIVSNAQFYTPLLFPALVGRSHADYGFDDGLSVWSYKEREGKPSIEMYRKISDKLARAGISPETCLYVGNDMRNDIRPAGELGFRTVLFAGDHRSLRWRKEDEGCRNIQPEFIITELAQLEHILG
jgi:putative hydrolase of the HAD superfamily